MISDNDILVLQQAVAFRNDQEAYNKLFLHFYPSLKEFAYTFLKSKALSDEVVSDVFIKIWQKRNTLHTISNIRLYLFTSTRNTAFNYLKKQQGLQNLPVEDYWVELKSIYFNPESLMITEEMIERIQKAIQQLPARCRLIFKLVKEEGLKYREVAELLEISVKTVENQMSLALKKLGNSINFDITRSGSPLKHA
ncbi:MAG: RNA polymerase sigma-70 factor [Chitinophagaceae bacterium]|nr:RNA polymerase sigma-70 factor [Chitinophagaceae bacterium]MCW5929354.1 RNA polymerase sigma-70 factor [Chitinophagaceae bacterium]